MRGITALPCGAVIAMALAGPAHAEGEAINGFPNWQERVMHEWTNRARCDPQVEMTACGSACSDAACYTPIAPLAWNEKLNRAARFHSDEMAAQGYFAHDSACDLVSNIDSLYPATCTGAATCACQGGTKTCSGACTYWNERVALFGVNPSGEIIAGSSDPSGAFYQWLYESYNKTTCAYDMGSSTMPTNGHRWNLLKGGPTIGFGKGAGASVGDLGGSGTLAKLPSGSHYPRQAATVDAWANWYNATGPKSALVNVDGMCTAMALTRGTVTNGAYKASLSGVGTGCHRYFFLFKDAADNIVTYPTTGSLGIGPAGSCADWDTSRPSTGAGCDCAPQCSGKVCGDDGCGGSCGNCAAGETCDVGVCVAPPPDAGVSDDAGGGGNNGGDAGLDGGNAGADGGCGCSADAGGELLGGGWLVVGVSLLLRRRRRRR